MAEVSRFTLLSWFFGWELALFPVSYGVGWEPATRLGGGEVPVLLPLIYLVLF
jgi:hypothetical protein